MRTKKMPKVFAVLVIISIILTISIVPAFASNVTPVQKYGKLRIDEVSGINQLCDQNGNPVQLNGMSSFGLQWADGYWILNDNAFDALAYDWECDIIRLAMYVGESGYASNPRTILDRVEEGIRLATARGMYVMVDWHVLSPGDPMNSTYLNAGLSAPDMPDAFNNIKTAYPDWTGPQVFFAYIAEKYGNQGNILYEPANEPNSLGNETERFTTWSNRLKPYYENVIDAIRLYDQDGIIICGTDNWSQFVDGPINDPLNDSQVMYTMHFYAGTHDAGYNENEDGTFGNYWLRKMTDNALENGLAVFCTEWGTSLATGDGGPYIDFAERWLQYMNDNGISWTAWSMAQKNEISAAFLSTTSPNPQPGEDGTPAWTYGEMSVSGRFYRAKIRGDATPMYSSSELVTDFNIGNPMFDLNADNPNTNLSILLDEINGDAVAKLIGVNTGGIWSNRIQLSDIDFLFGIYQDLEFEIYLDANKVDINSGAPAFIIKPVFQYPPSWWYDSIPDVNVPANAFTPVENTSLVMAKVTIPISPLNPSANETVNHIVFLHSLTDMTAGADVYIDKVAFSTNFNGDVSKLPELPDEPGTFIKLPFDFESGTREGWVVEGTSKASNKQLSIGTAESKALKFPAAFEIGKNEWEDGYRLSSPMALGTYGLDYWQDIRYVIMEVYLEAGKATEGVLQMEVCPIPNGAGYWYQIPGSVSIDPLNDGTPVIALDGKELLKYTLIKPFNINEYSQPNIRPRNLVLALHGSDCDYTGDIYYDNITFLTQEEYENIMPTSFTLTVEAGNGGTVTGGGTYANNSSATIKATPDTGYIFDGWYENDIKVADADAEYTFVITSDRTLQARFIEDEPSSGNVVTFDTGDGSAIEPLDLSLNSLIPRPANPTLTDKLFVGWYKDSSFTNVWLFDEDKVTDDMTLYAKWIDAPEADSGTFKVIIDPLNRGEIIVSDVNSGDTMTRPSDPTRNGYAFSGWYLDYNWTTPWNFSTSVTDNMTLYSKWVKVQSNTTTPTFAPTAPVSVTTINDPYVYVDGSSSNITSATETLETGCGLSNAVINAKNITIKAGDKFNIMNGVTARDDGGKGADLTKKITVRGTINTHKPGKYNLTYSVKGCNGNKVSRTITVTVK